MSTKSETPALTAPQPGATPPSELPILAPEPSAPRTTATTAPDDPPAAPSPPPAPAEAPKPPAPERDYAAERVQARLDRLVAEKAALAREVEKLKSNAPADAAAIQAEINEKAAKLAAEEAVKIAEWKNFTDSLNTAIAEGQKEFGADKFDASVAKLRTLHDPADQDANTKYLTMLQAIVDTGAAPKLIRALGDDPNEAARIMTLSPTRMGMELGKLAAKDIEAVSSVPKPITPITGTGRNHAAIAAEDPERADNLDMRVWMERRNAHVTEQAKRRAGR